MSALLTGVIGVVATLLGSLTTYLFQSRTAERAEAFARSERLRQEQLIACSAYAGALSELKQASITLWFLRDDQTGPAWRAARAAGDRLGSSAEAARFRVQLVAEGQDLMMLADRAFRAIGTFRAAASRNELEAAEERFEMAVRDFIAAAAGQLRAAGLHAPAHRQDR
jgi:hypothetical protein